MAAAPKATNGKTAPVETVDLLPRWREEDVPFVVELLRTYGRRTMRACDLARDLNCYRDERYNPADGYKRILAALHEAERRGLVRKSGRYYGLP